MSTPAASLVNAHEWMSASLAGTQFAYLNYRGNIASCVIYSFETASVTTTVNGVTSGAFTVNPYTAVVRPSLDSDGRPVLIESSTNPILVGCYEGTSDYSNVYPVHSGSLYGFHSRNTRGAYVNCVTLSSVLSSETPVCTGSDGITVTVSVDISDEFFSITANSGSRYAGNGMVCTPSPGNCLAIFTHADSDGNEGAHWTRDTALSDYFVFPESIRLTTLISGGSVVNCDLTDSVGTFVKTLSTAGASGSVKHVQETPEYNKGHTLSCDGNVGIIGSYNQEEFNLYGREGLVSVNA